MNETLIAGKSFPWEHVSGYFLRVRLFTKVATISGDDVGRPILGTYGLVNAELPNPDVNPDERIITLPIEHKSDYKSVFRAQLDSGVAEGRNELVVVYEHRRGIFGLRKPCFHVAAYPTGTWQEFYEAVDRYDSQNFQWPEPLFLYQPSSTTVFPSRVNLFAP